MPRACFYIADKDHTLAPKTYIVGDIHGQYDRLTVLLQEHGLIDPEGLRWTGADARLWFIGDFFDRGPQGIDVVNLIMRLQQEAPLHGGQVGALMGNHEPLILSAYHFGEIKPQGNLFMMAWLRNGGIENDMAHFTPAHVEWLTNLPVMALLEDQTLLVHADSDFYTRYGNTLDEINKAFRAIMQTDDIYQWARLLDDFGDRYCFLDSKDPHGTERAARFLERFGAKRLIHGHTPIRFTTGQNPSQVVAAYVYADGLCINVDSGMYLGGPGFIHELT